MNTAVIVDAIRSPLGRRNGKLKNWHPVDLASEIMQQLVQRNDLDPALIDDVVMGCVMQVGEQSLNVARNAVACCSAVTTWPAAWYASTASAILASAAAARRDVSALMRSNCSSSWATTAARRMA